MIVRIWRLENGVPQNSGIGFFIDNNRILSAYHVHGHLGRQEDSTYVAVLNNQSFPISPLKTKCAKDLVIYESNELICHVRNSISTIEPIVGETVLIKSTEREIPTPIFLKCIMNPPTIQFNYTCLLDVDSFFTSIAADAGMSGSVILNSKSEIVGLYSGNSQIDNINNGNLFGFCININEIVAFINE